PLAPQQLDDRRVERLMAVQVALSEVDGELSAPAGEHRVIACAPADVGARRQRALRMITGKTKGAASGALLDYPANPCVRGCRAPPIRTARLRPPSSCARCPRLPCAR